MTSLIHLSDDKTHRIFRIFKLLWQLKIWYFYDFYPIL